MEFTTQFADVYEQLPTLDFELLGDASRRNDELLGDFYQQKLRLCKLFAVRKVIKHSAKNKSKLEQERIKSRYSNKRAQQAAR